MQCECNGPGYCERFKRHMVGRLYEICADVCPPERPCPPAMRERYLTSWLRQAGRTGPSLVRKAGNFARSAVQHVRSGRERAPAELIERRLAICRGNGSPPCPLHSQDAKGRDVCNHSRCGCKLTIKTGWKNETCPLNKWPSDDNNGGTALDWSYGVTTVPERLNDLLPRTLKSLKAGGFPKPRLFVDGAGGDADYLRFGLPITLRRPRIGLFANWMLTIWELYLRSPRARYFAVFQDDFVTYRNLRQYIERTDYPSNSYLNLYNFRENPSRAPQDYVGWYPASQKGRGAVALVFDATAVVALLSQGHMALRAQNVHRSHSSVDGGIVTALNKAGIREYVHHPSLVQHTGVTSIKRPGTRQAQAPYFYGENYDALELLKSVKPSTVSTP